ncbi:MAG: hypothetical protein RIB84_05855 [Sneathiellaceae bacterium]
MGSLARWHFTLAGIKIPGDIESGTASAMMSTRPETGSADGSCRRLNERQENRMNDTASRESMETFDAEFELSDEALDRSETTSRFFTIGYTGTGPAKD